MSSPQPSSHFPSLCLFLLFASLSSSEGSVSNPLLPSGDLSGVLPDYQDIKTSEKKYHEHEIEKKHEARPLFSLSDQEKEQARDGQVETSCGVNIRSKWSTSLNSGVFSAPVSYPSGVDGKKDIFLSTFYQFIEVLGYDGYKPWGFPLSFEESSFQASPVLYDVDEDGENDIGVVDKNGNLYWVRLGEFGQYLEDYHVQVPKLKIKKDWADGMDPKFVDNYVMTSMFDHDYAPLKKTQKKAKQDELETVTSAKQATYPEQSSPGGESSSRRLSDRLTSRTLMAVDEDQKHDQHDSENVYQKKIDAVKSHVSLREREKSSGMESDPETDTDTASKRDDDYVEPQAPEFRDEFLDDDYVNSLDHQYGGKHHYGVIHGDDFGYGMGYGVFAGFNDSNFVFVDPHVLSTPVLMDVNNDGDAELVMAVSYYFDKFSIENRQNLDYDPDNFIAGGVASWNIAREEWSWLVHLDLTTDKTKFNALIYSSPTIADLDGDGRKEVIIGTSLGLLYVLDGDSGFTRRFFPMQFHQIQAQVAVADVVGGSDLEMLVGDLVGNLVCVNADGDVLWDARLSGAIHHSPTLGDVDGDGDLDVVVTVAALEGYQVYAVEGATGEVLPGFPIALPSGAEVSGPVLLLDLHSYLQQPSTKPSKTSYTPGVPGGTVVAPSRGRTGVGVTPGSYDDPFAPSWTVNTKGHEPAPAPSEHHQVEKEAEKEEEEGGSRRLSSMRGSKSSSHSNSNEETKAHSGLHFLIPSFDGHVYLLDGHHSCAERIDIGEHIASTPLFDDIDANGLMDIVVGTLHGTVHVLETQVPYHPLNAWTSFPKHRGNGFTHGQIGLSIPQLEKRRLRYSDVKGGSVLQITFDIWDTRRQVARELGLESGSDVYKVVLTKGTNKMNPIHSEGFSRPGRYTITVPVTPPGEDSLVLGMYTDHGMYFEDHVDVALSTRFYVWIKYLAIFPVGLLCLPLLITRAFKHS